MKIDLSTNIGYDIASAMRGPDADFGNAKYIFTARIRYLFGVQNTECFVRDAPLTESNVEHFVAWLGCLAKKPLAREDFKHYIDHCCNALRHNSRHSRLSAAAFFVGAYCTNDANLDDVRAALMHVVEGERDE